MQAAAASAPYPITKRPSHLSPLTPTSLASSPEVSIRWSKCTTSLPTRSFTPCVTLHLFSLSLSRWAMLLLHFRSDSFRPQPDSTHIAAGMSDGTLSVRQRQQKASQSGQDLADTLTTGTYETFLGGALSSVGQGRVKSKAKSTFQGDVDELRVESRRAPRLREYDRLLKSFKYSAALDAVLRKVRSLTRFLFSTVLSLLRTFHL